MSIREMARVQLSRNHPLVSLMDQFDQPSVVDAEKMTETLLAISVILCEYQNRRTWHLLVLWLLELVERQPQNAPLMAACRLALARAAGAQHMTGEAPEHEAREELVRFYATRPEFCPPDDSYRIYVRTALHIYRHCGQAYDRRLLMQAACNVPWYELLAEDQMIDVIPLLAKHIGCTELIWPGWNELPRHSNGLKLNIPKSPTLILDVIQADIARMRSACRQHFMAYEQSDFRNLKIGPSLLLEGFLLQFLANIT